MYLEKLTLADWKLYGGENSFAFPAPNRRKNVILIGAKNGFGKTSFLEAVVFGLYGREGIDLAARVDGVGDEERRARNYRKFVEGAFNEAARKSGRTTMRVELAFVSVETGERVQIRRTWTFRNNGSFHEEHVELFVNGRAKSPGRAEVDPEDYFRGLIQRATMPPHLARFFLFDGERVQALAEQNMAEQVRLGIEGFLGVRLLRGLEDDLRSYARSRRGSIKVGDDDKRAQLASDLEQREARRAELHGAIHEARQEEQRSEHARDQILGELAALGGGAVHDLRALTQDIARWDRSHEDAVSELHAKLGGDFAIALVGHRLRSQALVRLEAEKRLAQREAGIEASRGQVDRFVELMLAADPELAPPLTTEQLAALRLKVGSAWEGIWNPPADGTASEYRHPALSDLDRGKVLDVLRRTQRLGPAAISELLERIEDAAVKRRALQNDISGYQSVEEGVIALRERLGEVNQRVIDNVGRRRELERQESGLDTEIQAMRADLERQMANHREAAPERAKIELATKIAELVEPFIQEAVGGCVAEVAEGMTVAFKAMAHKQYLDRIVIDDECNVQMLDRGGENLREQSLSAGENQVFASSLISALAQAAEIQFPLIIDTPLARLDLEHRRNVLRHFSENAGDQVIFLSQDAELTGELYDLVKPRVAATFLIENEARAGSKTGKARVLAGKYFDS